MSKILIIDDDPMILKLYSEFLSKEGFEVLTASDADKGFELAVSRMPDLVLLDVMMPGTDGTQAHERFSKDPKTTAIKVAFLTALVKDEEVAASGGNIGGLEYISKSTPKEEFVRRVRGLLGSNKLNK